MFRSVLLSTATLVLAAQAPAPETPKPAAPAAAPAAAKSVKAAKAAKPAGKKPADAVIATIGKVTVHQSDFQLFLDTTLNDQQRLQLQFVPGAMDRYQDQYLNYMCLAAKAKREGLDKQPGHAKKLAILDMQLLIQSLMDKDGPTLQKKISVTNDEAKAYYQSHLDKFTSPETFTVRHILVGTKGADGKGLSDADALAKAQKIEADLKGGKKFEDAAKEFSDDPGSKDNGGLYEDTPFGKFVPEFDKAVRSQEIGKVGEPVKTQFGYHIIKVEKITPAKTETFDAAKDEAKEQATSERQEQVMQAYLQDVRKEMGFKLVPVAKAAEKAPADGGDADAAAPAAADKPADAATAPAAADQPADNAGQASQEAQ